MYLNLKSYTHTVTTPNWSSRTFYPSTQTFFHNNGKRCSKLNNGKQQHKRNGNIQSIKQLINNKHLDISFSAEHFLCITATLGNVLVLIALHKVSSICPPTKLMFRFLAVTDLCVGLISHPLSAVFLLNSPRLNNIFFISFFVSSLILPVPSVLTSAAIAVDRLLALMLRLRYRHVVTLRRVRAVILCFCSVSVLCGALFITSIFAFSTRNMRYLVFNVIFNGSIILALVTSTYSYTKIFFTLHRHQAQLQGHLNQNNQTKEEIHWT